MTLLEIIKNKLEGKTILIKRARLVTLKFKIEKVEIVSKTLQNSGIVRIRNNNNESELLTITDEIEIITKE